MKKGLIEPPLAQSSKGAPHTLNHLTPSPPFPQSSLGGTWTRSFSILFLPVTIDISKSPQVRFLIVWLSLIYFPVYQLEVRNSVHLPLTYIPHLHHLQLEAHLETSQRLQWGLFCKNNKRVDAVCYFRWWAPPWIWQDTKFGCDQ